MCPKNSYNKAGSTAKLRVRDKDREKKLSSEAKSGKAGGRWFWFFLVVLVIAALSYANSLENEYIFDDFHLILSNPQVTSIDSTARDLLSGKLPAYYRPLRTISYALDYTLNKNFWYRFASQQWTDRGLIPLGYHLANIFYHIITALLVYLVIYRLSSNARVAFIGASLFALHPVHTESVAYLSGRRDILSTLFYLAGFYYFLCYRQGKQIRFIVAAFLMYMLSLGSKEMGVTLPGLFLAYDLVKNFNHNESSIGPGYWKALFLSAKKSFQQSYVLYPVAFLGTLAYSCYAVFIKSASRQDAYYGDSAFTTFLTVGRILVHYIKLLVYPIRLNADYSYNAFPLSVSLYEPSAFLSIVLLLLIGYLTLKLLVNHKMAAFGIAWFFITVLPVCHIIPHHEMMAEHYLYLPSVGLCLVAALTGERSLAKGGHTLLLTGCFLTVVALFSLRIWDRNRDWSDSLTLYEKTVKTAPQCARAHNDLGNALTRAGRLEEAASAFKQALAIKPDFADARNNLGIVYTRSGDVDAAITEYKRVLALTPKHTKAIAYNNLAWIYATSINEAQRDGREAVALAIKACELTEFKNAGFLDTLAAACAEAGYFKSAVFYQKKALAMSQEKEQAALHVRLRQYESGQAYRSY
jgi:tetratricopeptide (TPR) repeat protein